jgi:hypothetical protein
VGLVFMVVTYFVIPVERGIDTVELVVRSVVSAIGIVVAARLIGRRVRRQLGGDESPLAGLVVSIVAAVLFFALVDYVVAISYSDQFADLNTRVDALYFALTTLSTVGFGDVPAQGQLARALLCVQLVFNVVVIATAASILTRQLERRLRQRDDQLPNAG